MHLPIEAIIFSFFASGIGLKLADIYGERGKGYIPAIITATSMGILISESPSSSSIILGIVLGVALAGKIDQTNLRIGLGLTLIIAIILGFKIPIIQLLVIITTAALIDEVGHDRATFRSISWKFFRFRMTLKTTMIVLAILGWIDTIYVIGFFCFDITYDITDIIWVFKEKKKKA